MYEPSKLDQIFTPDLVRRYEGLGPQSRFVHYTSAENALSIIQGKSIWLRNTLFMNDFSEMQYGLGLVDKHFNSSRSGVEKFWAIVDACTNSRAAQLKALFNGWVLDLYSGTFVFCLSQHNDNEDELGRLSMWRAYGKPNSVALVIKSNFLEIENEALGSTTCAIEYLRPNRAERHFDWVIENVIREEAYLRSAPPDAVYQYVLYSLHTLALTTKHPGFAEEKEWRIIHRPNWNASPVLIPKIVSVGGAPQKIFELPLAENAAHNIRGISLPQLLDRVIIGPSTHGQGMAMAFVEALVHAGVEDARERVFFANIPLRNG